MTKFVSNLIFVIVFTSFMAAARVRADSPKETVLYASQAPLLEQNPGAEPMPDPPAAVPTAQASKKYVALLNGSILFGDLKLIGDQYEITTETGMVIIPQNRVSQIAGSLRQIYDFKASQVFVNDLEKRCELLRWCFQYELVNEAEEQLTLLKKYSPDHPLCEVFERRLTFLKNKKEREALAAETPESSEAPEETQTGPTYAELQRFATTIPEESIEIFRKKVQPILQRSCMMADCHGPNTETPYRLLRIHAKMGRGEILQNLYASVQQIDLARPEQSPFLRKPVTPHGNDSRTVFLCQDYATYQILIAWTYLVARNQYVIPRDRLLPPQPGAPVFTPTQRGLVRVSSHSAPVQVGPCQMWGVDPSLYPQNLYPEMYPRNPAPNGAYVAGGVVAPGASVARQEPQIKLVLSRSEEDEEPLESPENAAASEPEVLPAAAETDEETESEAVQQVSVEDEEKPKTVKRKTRTDWNAVLSSFGEALGEMPAEEKPAPAPAQNAPENAEPAQTQQPVPAYYAPGQNTAQGAFYAPGQNTNEGPVYAPGQSSISKVYAPGQSSAEKLKRGNASAGLTASPIHAPAPQSPMELMQGRDSVQHGGGSYTYGASGMSEGSKAAPAQTRTHVWEQMLEMQGGLQQQGAN